MEIKRILFLISLIFTFSGCQSIMDSNAVSSNITPVQILEKPIYPVLEEIIIPEDPVLIPMTVDMPRKSHKSVKNVPHCLDVPESERNELFWNECEDNEIILDSNLYVGFNINEWENLQINLIRIKEYANLLKEILNEVNIRIRDIKETEKREIEEFNKRYEEFLKNINNK